MRGSAVVAIPTHVAPRVLNAAKCSNSSVDFVDETVHTQKGGRGGDAAPRASGAIPGTTRGIAEMCFKKAVGLSTVGVTSSDFSTMAR